MKHLVQKISLANSIYYYLFITIIILIAVFLRFHNLNWNPAWYTDEGTHIEIARHLITGNDFYLGITDSYLIAARLPLFEHLLAFWFRLVGVDMLFLRILTSFIGMLTVAMTYKVAYLGSRNKIFALISMALLSINPFSVIYSRFGFSYNLTGLLILISVALLLKFKRHQARKYIILASLTLGLATLSDFIAFSFIPAVILFNLLFNRKTLFVSMFVLSVPFAIYASYELSQHPQIFIYDLSYTLARAGGLPLNLQIDNLFNNVRIILSDSVWVLLGVVGTVFIKQRQLKWALILFIVIPIMISGRTVALYNLSAYYMIPFTPFFAIGSSALLYYSSSTIKKIISSIQISIDSISVIMCSLICLISVIGIYRDIQSGFVIGIEHFLISTDEAHQAKDVFDYEKERGLIITSPTLAWMFDQDVTDFQISSLSQADSVHFPSSLFPERFAFDIDYKNARYAIVDNLWRDWGAVHMPVVAKMLNHVKTWELIFESKTIQIYRNPKA